MVPILCGAVIATKVGPTLLSITPFCRTDARVLALSHASKHAETAQICQNVPCRSYDTKQCYASSNSGPFLPPIPFTYPRVTYTNPCLIFIALTRQAQDFVQLKTQSRGKFLCGILEILLPSTNRIYCVAVLGRTNISTPIPSNWAAIP